MKTPIQELIDIIKQRINDDAIPYMYNEIILELAESLLEKEKEVMCQFADEFAIECINFHHEKTMSQEQFFNLTFNTKEK